MRRPSCAVLVCLLGLAACAAPPPRMATPTLTATATLVATATPIAEPSPLPTPTRTPTLAPPPEDRYAGWAVVAYPAASQAEMEALLRRQKDAGANVVWIGHNNPGEASAEKAEPGLSYAVWAAAQDPRHPQHSAAAAMIEAQHRMLRAARAIGLPAVFPIGYQIHMGRDWRDVHPKEMRHDAAGQWLDIFNGGVSASPYSTAYRADIRRYYEWVRAEFVTPYRDVILMLNLADEPLGGDYSAPAEREFTRRTGQTFAGADPLPLGAFQDRVIVDYAVWSAEQWLGLAPDVPVTMSFCGAQGRWSYHMPNVEALFRETPRNFVPTFDAYLHDYLPWEPLTEAEVGSLALFARTLGYYSQRYDREFWLWSAGNRWGLAGYDSPNPGGVSDAVANGYLLTLAVRSTSGQLRGLAVWNYNVKDQGLYGDADPAPYDREALFEHVSGSFAEWRRLMAAPGGQARALLLLTDRAVHTYLGETRNAVFDSPIHFDSLLPFTRQDTPAAVVSALPALAMRSNAVERHAFALAGVETVIVLDPTAQTLAATKLDALRGFADSGGRLLASAEVLAVLWPTADARPPGALPLPGSPFEMGASDWAGLFPGSAGIHVSNGNGGQALFYAPAGAAHLPDDRQALPLARHWRVFDHVGQRRAEALEWPSPRLRAHEFALSP